MAAKTSTEEIRALLTYIYQAKGIWISREQVNHLIGGSNKHIDEVRAEVIAEHQGIHSDAYFAALAFLHGYKTPQDARNKVEKLLETTNYQRLDRDELRAIAAIQCPETDTTALSKKDLADLLTSSHREAFRKTVMALKIPSEEQINQKIYENLTRRGQINYYPKLEDEVKEENEKRKREGNPVKATKADLLAKREIDQIIKQIGHQ